MIGYVDPHGDYHDGTGEELLRHCDTVEIVNDGITYVCTYTGQPIDKRHIQYTVFRCKRDTPTTLFYINLTIENYLTFTIRDLRRYVILR